MSYRDPQSTSGVAEVLGHIRGKGVRIWSEKGQLHYKAPKGALTREEIECLRLMRSEIVAVLEGARGSATVQIAHSGRAGAMYQAPLAFTQMAHWHLYRLGRRPSWRQVACATRLRGCLNIEALAASLQEIVRRHDALRTRIVVVDGVPMQEVSAHGECELRVTDLTGLAEAVREASVRRFIETDVCEAVNLANDPLFVARVLQLGPEEHVLTLAMEHMISDGVSRDILLRELLMAYSQALEGLPFCLPEVPLQFSDYAAWRNSEQQRRASQPGADWNTRLAECERVRFPSDNDNDLQGAHWGAVPVHIGRETKMRLSEWCRLRRTTLVMSVLTAYVALVLRWCSTSEAVFRFETDGRISPRLANTIGYLAFPIYLRVRLHDGDTFLSLLARVTAEYYAAYEHADFSYLEAQEPRPGFTRNTCFNWLPQEPKGDEFATLASEVLTCSRIPFGEDLLKAINRDAEPMVGLLEAEEEVRGNILFPLDRFSAAGMERLSRNFLHFIEMLLRQPSAEVKSLQLL